LLEDLRMVDMRTGRSDVGTNSSDEGETATIAIAAFYKFFPVADPDALLAPVTAALESLGIRGTVLFAYEGMNGTIAGPLAALNAAIPFLENHTGSGTLELKRSYGASAPFRRLRVRHRPEIVTLGLSTAEADPSKHVGKYVEPEDWNALILDPDVLVIDTRNSYEVRIGSFKGAIDPKTSSFGQLPVYVRGELTAADRKRKVAMFCTGGIRCEKATALMVAEGFEEVYHLRGGILSYLERVPEAQSLWTGGCYVFDERIAVGHGLVRTDHSMCKACGSPLSAEDRAHPDYVLNLRCGFCSAKP
jgi:UPF0176 protein